MSVSDTLRIGCAGLDSDEQVAEAGEARLWASYQPERFLHLVTLPSVKLYLLSSKRQLCRKRTYRLSLSVIVSCYQSQFPQA